jgi:hypothetical protein
MTDPVPCRGGIGKDEATLEEAEGVIRVFLGMISCSEQARSVRVSPNSMPCVRTPRTANLYGAPMR